MKKLFLFVLLSTLPLTSFAVGDEKEYPFEQMTSAVATEAGVPQYQCGDCPFKGVSRFKNTKEVKKKKVYEQGVGATGDE